MGKIDDELFKVAIDFLVALREGSGIDETLSVRLRALLHDTAKHYENSEFIPKVLANLFIDLANGVESISYAYKGEEGDRIRLFADELAGLVRACVAWHEGE